MRSDSTLKPRIIVCLFLLLAGSLACNLIMWNSYFVTVVLLNALIFLGAIHARQFFGANIEVVSRVNDLTDIKSNELGKKAVSLEKISAIENVIHSKKLYLDSNMNLKIFSEHVGLKPREVSNVINSHYGVNFFEFINRFRVEEAKRLLMIENSADSVLDILYKSGFNSPSAFHRIFKRFEGVTPSTYRGKKANK